MTSLLIPITPETCTVLGYDVKADSPLWTGLRWDKVTVDKGPDPFGGSGYEYLHVGYVQPEDGDDGCVYRVRPKKEPGDNVMVKGQGWCRIERIEVAGIIEGRWCWRYLVKAKGE